MDFITTAVDSDVIEKALETFKPAYHPEPWLRASDHTAQELVAVIANGKNELDKATTAAGFVAPLDFWEDMEAGLYELLEAGAEFDMDLALCIAVPDFVEAGGTWLNIDVLGANMNSDIREGIDHIEGNQNYADAYCHVYQAVFGKPFTL